MIINNMADASVGKSELITFSPRDIKATIRSGENVLSVVVPQNTYKDVDVSKLGPSPYSVQLGYVNDSYMAKPVTVSGDAMVTFWMAFPAGPNGPNTFVFKPS
jgi:hypothetical protein